MFISYYQLIRLLAVIKKKNQLLWFGSTLLDRFLSWISSNSMKSVFRFPDSFAMSNAKHLLKRLVLFPLIILTSQLLHIAKQFILTIIDLFVQKKHPGVVRTPEERFQGLEALGYTFKANYVELPIGGGKTLPRVHYIDEG